MDYKILLKKYMEHVVYCEGINFILHIDGEDPNGVNFTDEEVKALEQISH